MASDYYTPPTRSSLILRLRNRDDLVAWQEFVEIYQPVINSLAMMRGLQAADADDVTQEVLTRVARAIDDWDPNPKKGSFRGWLAAITRNLVVQCFRESDRRPAAGVDSKVVESLASPNGGLRDEDFQLEHERQLFVWAARKVQTQFEDKTWQAFWLTAVESQPVAQVAGQLYTTCAQVYVSRSRVMNQLKKMIQRSQFDSQPDWVAR